MLPRAHHIWELFRPQAVEVRDDYNFGHSAGYSKELHLPSGFYEITFKYYPPGVLDIRFTLDGETLPAHLYDFGAMKRSPEEIEQAKNDTFVVLRTIVSMIHHLKQRHVVQSVIFTAALEHRSKVHLYDRFSRFLARQLGGQTESRIDGDYKEYRIHLGAETP